MDIDYKAIKEENLRKYGTDIGRIGDMLLANRYDDRTHFIYEILQNAEDALKKRGGWEDSRAVEFSVSSNTLKISHFGKPFDEADVRGICGSERALKNSPTSAVSGLDSSRSMPSQTNQRFTLVKSTSQ